MRLAFTITPDLDASAAGEMLLSYINDADRRWGYSTRVFKRGGFQLVTDKVPPLDVRTCCCGCFAKIPSEYERIDWWRSDELSLDIFLHWDGDGTIVIRHPDWMLENGDCKHSDEWEWVDGDHWSADLRPDYYETERTI